MAARVKSKFKVEAVVEDRPISIDALEKMVMLLFDRAEICEGDRTWAKSEVRKVFSAARRAWELIV